ncbi:dihydropteroate synthase [Bacillus lacus]|uniref:Dihydropteroate synthase n=1 Tax=Metabacillus lacus TaxID=1983721 RepID=A0A7X2LZ27_9BACI|nr:dihydropteroate synthase [Metabacillus lacus]MRX72981.1 dihydropteroate synthase [Metabacillus lacus]
MIIAPASSGFLVNCGEYTLNLHSKTAVMGILNITPDSFSDGGQYMDPKHALIHAEEMVKNGADIIDIGGESTRPGALPVSEEEELKRVVPIVSLLSEHLKVPISIDTYKAEVARQAVNAGASMINDVWGGKADPQMLTVAAAAKVPIVLMHNRQERDYHDLIEDMVTDLNESVKLAKSAGVMDEHIILDPGIGFAKNFEDNLIVMRNLEVFSSLGYPVLLGTSRKRFIGTVLGTEPDERMEGTGATVCMGIQKGCSIVRVHDVLEIARMAKMMDAMLGKGDVSNR